MRVRGLLLMKVRRRLSYGSPVWLLVVACGHSAQSRSTEVPAPKTACREPNTFNAATEKDLRCGHYGIRVIRAAGCNPDTLEPELEHWSSPLRIWIDGMVERKEV